MPHHMKHLAKLAILVAGAAAYGCGTPRQVPTADGGEQSAPPVFVKPDRGSIIRSEERLRGQAVAMMPRAVAYRMSGDYADNVPVTLASDGTLQSYPDPSDITAASTPLPLEGGWWLDRRGISGQSVFTRFTYAGYAAMKQAPSPQQMLEAVIPGARVTAVMQLPMTTQEAVADTAAANASLKRLDVRL